MIKKQIPMPEVIEADPIDADIVNPRICPAPADGSHAPRGARP